MYSNVYSEKVKQVIDQIIGPNNAEPFGCGWWMLTFPGFEQAVNNIDDVPATEPVVWKVDGNWHIDGHIHKHYTYSKEIGLIPIMFFSDVHVGGGGTAIAEGSHLVAARILAESGLKGMTSKDLARAVMIDTQESFFNIIELTGQAGDIIFMHPLLLHARSTNLAKLHEDGIRFMCHPAIPMKRHMNFNLTFESLSLLEKSMVCGTINIHSNYILAVEDIDDIVQIHQDNYSISQPLSIGSTSQADITTLITTINSPTAEVPNSIHKNNNNDIISHASSTVNVASNSEFPPLCHLNDLIDAAMMTLKGITPENCLKFQQRKHHQQNRKKSRGRKRNRNHNENYDNGEAEEELNDFDNTLMQNESSESAAV